MPHFIVIGSGPSGMACAAALLAGRAEVTMIDVGHDMAHSARERLSAIAQQAPSAWSPEDYEWMTAPLLDSNEAVPLKTLFGDPFVYEGGDWVLGNTVAKDLGLRPSHAIGGLSRVWGATLGRFDHEDLRDWPISLADLSAHYAAVESMLPVMDEADLPASPQAKQILARWDVAPTAMAALGARATPARLAVDRDCRRCGLCLHGCPYNYIFSSAPWALTKRACFTYRPGLRVLRVEESRTGAHALCLAMDGTAISLAADRIFVGAGALGTPRLILASLGRANDAVTLRDSQYYLLPFLTSHSHPPKSPHLALAQIFLRIDDPGISAKPLRAQLYTYNDVYAAQIAGKAGRFRRLPLVRRLAAAVGRRIVVAQGYLPSQDSRTARLSLDNRGDKSVLLAEIDASPRTPDTVRRVWKRLAKIGRLAGLIAVPQLGQITSFGRGFHSGGTFPMSREPHGIESDTLGRPAGLNRIHVVDASCWPSIPAGPVTLTTMANAHRIGTSALSLG
jgi:choline dehydrogenase-like flavoprotein